MGMKLTGLVISAIMMAHGAAAQTAAELYSCSVDQRQAVYWQAIGETVTLRGELFGYETFPPEGRQSLIFADGYEVVIGEGGKYIDNSVRDLAPSCAEYLMASIDPTLASMSNSSSRGSAGFSDMAALDAARASSAACSDQTGRYAKHGGLFCEQWSDLDTNFDGRDALYDRLVDERAPIIVVPYSTQGVDYLAYDPSERTFHPLFFAGY
ncbi:MAG: hypothetical protein AAFV54_10520 [Pseudomonadota bacterium]